MARSGDGAASCGHGEAPGALAERQKKVLAPYAPKRTGPEMKRGRHRRSAPPRPGRLDLGIRRAVEVLKAAGIETFESCEGGKGHAYTEPTVRFHGTPEAGWRAVGACLAYGLPVLALRRVWYVLDLNEPTGPDWELVFRERVY
jgi:hypothetical protein